MSLAAKDLVSSFLLNSMIINHSSFYSIDEVTNEELTRKFSMAFEEQFHYGCYYAYLKLKEQEIKNVTWLADLVIMQAPRNLPGWNKVVIPFMYHANDEIDLNQ